MPASHNHRAGERPALLILPLTNGHLMVSRVSRSDTRTLATLNKWYPQFFEALALLQKGNVDYVAGRGVIALHRDYGEPWQECQPRFFRCFGRDGSHGQRAEHLAAVLAFICQPTG